MTDQAPPEVPQPKPGITRRNFVRTTFGLGVAGLTAAAAGFLPKGQPQAEQPSPLSTQSTLATNQVSPLSTPAGEALQPVSPLNTPEAASAPNSQTETLRKLVDRMPLPSYEPSLPQRPVIDMDSSIVPTVRIHNAPDFINRASGDLNAVIAQIEHNSENKIINPDLSELMWFQIAGQEHFFNPPTLLQILKNLSADLKDGRVLLESTEDMQSFGGTLNDFFILDGEPHMAPTRILFQNLELAKEVQQSFDSPAGRVGESNLSCLTTLVYEYGNRLNDLSLFLFLKTNKIFDQFPPQSGRDIFDTIRNFRDEARYRSRPVSPNGNKLQLGFATSLATLAGNTFGRVRGMERNESWPAYKLHLGALNGDNKSERSLDTYLAQTATY